MPPNISSRAFIQWLPEGERSEPTSTIVLISSQRRFVDIRMITPLDQTQQQEQHQHSNQVSNPATSSTPPQNLSSLDWAFAGTSTSSTSAHNRVHTQWHHWVDSTTLTPEEVVDKGEMMPEDPASGISLEKGEMVKPETGRMTEYLEGWADVEPRAVLRAGEGEVEGFLREMQGRGVFVDGRKEVGESAGGDVGRLSIVLRHENLSRNSRGMVVRVGHICQGVLRIGEDFALERWTWVNEGQHAGWRRDYKLGTLPMPCNVLNVLGETMGSDSKVRYGKGEDLVWSCLEVERF